MVAFLALMIAGVVQLSASDTSTDDGGTSDVQSEENTATNDGSTDAVVPVTPTPASIDTATTTMATTTTAATDPPVLETVTIPISNAEVNIALPTVLEMKVPDFSDGLDSTEEQNWNLIESAIEETIYLSLSDSLSTTGYTVDSVQVDKFDGYITSSIRRRNMREKSRHLQNDDSDETILYPVEYSTTVTVSCLGIVDCKAASDVVETAISDLSQSEYLRVSVETDAPVTPSPMTPSPAVDATNKPSTSPTKKPTLKPVTDSPTGPARLADRLDGCNEYTPCEKCAGECSDDSECEEGLLCFQRRGYEFIPGCEGPGRSGRSYCYDPFADGLTQEVLLSDQEEECEGKDRCGKCRGEYIMALKR